MSVQLPQLTLQQKWETAESNLVYFVVCGISYAKAHGQTAADFGAWAGQVAVPSWQPERGKGPRGLVEGISANKQQFQGFEMEILEDTPRGIRGRMRHFGDDIVRCRPQHEISVEDYLDFFDKKWAAIAVSMGLNYTQQADGEWVNFTVEG